MIERQRLLYFYDIALASANGQTGVRRYLKENELKCDAVSMIAIGKAASAMAKGAGEILGQRIQRAMVITKKGFSEKLPWQTIESAHPIPDQTSLDAGQQLIKFCRATPFDHHVLFLLSGGASSLVEVLTDNISLQDWQNLNIKLLNHDCDIHEINLERQQYSKIKYGGLRQYFSNQAVTQLIISDVMNDDLAVIGSGLLYQEKNSHIIANNTFSLNAVSKAAMACQLPVEIGLPLQGNAEVQGQKIAENLLQAPPGLYLYGGETTMRLPPNCGLGGRNQHLALVAAKYIKGHDDCFILSAASDGNDGPTSYAGGLVDGKTIYRGEIKGLDINEYLKTANSSPYLVASGDIITKGLTGTNVIDFVFALKKSN